MSPAEQARAALAEHRDTYAGHRVPTNGEVEDACAVLRRAYYADVRDVVADALDAVASGEVTDADALDTWLHETIDGCQRVIYTWQARLGLLASDNEDAYQDETGETPPDPSVAMYWAMRADVRDAMPDIDWEADDDAEGGES